MAKKKTDTKIKIAIATAIITAIGGIIGAYVGSPVADTQWEERPKVSLSLGEKGSYPHNTILEDEFGYYIPIFLNNRGESDGKTVFVASGINAKVRIGNIGGWEYEQILPFTILSNSTIREYPIYVLPDEGTKTISIGFQPNNLKKCLLFKNLMFSDLLS